MVQIRQLNPAGAGGRLIGKIVGEEKIDGHRGLLHLGGGLDRAYLTGRRISVKTNLLTEKGLNVPQFNVLNDHLNERGIGYTVFDGEVVIPGRPFEDVQSVMGALPEAALERQREIGFASYVHFDFLFVDGVDIRQRSLRWRWSEEDSFLTAHGIGDGFPLVRDGLFVEPKRSFELDELFSSIVAAGGEGTMEKSLEASYGFGWRKRKKEETYDVVVLDFTKGVGKFQEMIGAVVFGAYRDGQLVSVGKCSGMEDGTVYWSDSQGQSVAANSPGCRIRPVHGASQSAGSRAWFTCLQRELVGRVIEVKCNGVTRHGALRHPQFSRLRPDKSAEMCVAPKAQTQE